MTKIINAISLIPVNRIIQKTRFDNLDIIISDEDLNKTSALINTFLERKIDI